MIPPSKKLDFEKVRTDDFLTGSIAEIKYDLEHKSSYQGKEKIGPACRIIFTVDGYEFPHGTGWMTFNLSEKSNLFKKYVAQLVEGAEEYMEFDLDQLIGMKVKMLWADKGDWQHIDTIRPLGEKLKPIILDTTKTPPEIADDESVPF
jgi:hypothetical protein